MNSLTELLPAKQATALVAQPDLADALDNEIARHCHRKVTKRLALQLARAVLEDDHDGMFFAEKIAGRLQVRLRKEVALKEIYIERPTKK